MKLYFSPGACSMAPHLVLNEMGMQVEAVPVDLKAKTYAGGNYLAINPKGSVPALEVGDGEVLTEGAVVMQYLADKKPESGLIPKAGTWERYRCQEWLNYISSEVHKGFGPLWNPKASEETKNNAREMLAKKFDYLNQELKGKNFLMGSAYTVADAYLFTVTNWTRMLGIDLTKWPSLMGFYERVKTRPATLATMQSEGLLKG